MNRPLELTTPTHGVAVGAYWLAALLGISFLTPLNVSPAITEALGHYGFLGWATSMAASGAVALAAALLSLRLGPAEAWLQRRGWSRTTRLELVIRMEQVSCAGLAFTFALYLYALISPDLAALPPDPTPAEVVAALTRTFTTRLLAGTYVLGGVVRVVQVGRDLAKLRRSRDQPRPADPPLAELER